MSAAARHEVYLGDAVYVNVDEHGRGVRLYTSNGLRTTNEIFLDVEVLASFAAWLAYVRESAPAPHPGG